MTEQPPAIPPTGPLDATAVSSSHPNRASAPLAKQCLMMAAEHDELNLNGDRRHPSVVAATTVPLVYETRGTTAFVGVYLPPRPPLRRRSGVRATRPDGDFRPHRLHNAADYVGCGSIGRNRPMRPSCRRSGRSTGSVATSAGGTTGTVPNSPASATLASSKWVIERLDGTGEGVNTGRHRCQRWRAGCPARHDG